MYFDSLGPSHQRRYGIYAPIFCGLRGRYRPISRLIIASAYKELVMQFKMSFFLAYMFPAQLMFNI